MGQQLQAQDHAARTWSPGQVVEHRLHWAGSRCAVPGLSCRQRWCPNRSPCAARQRQEHVAGFPPCYYTSQGCRTSSDKRTAQIRTANCPCPPRVWGAHAFCLGGMPDSGQWFSPQSVFPGGGTTAGGRCAGHIDLRIDRHWDASSLTLLGLDFLAGEYRDNCYSLALWEWGAKQDDPRSPVPNTTEHSGDKSQCLVYTHPSADPGFPDLGPHGPLPSPSALRGRELHPCSGQG